MKRVIEASVAVLLLASSAAWAGPILDQYQELQSGMFSGPALGQTFTAGLSGVLDHVHVGNTSQGGGIPPDATPIVQIRDTVAGQPGSTVLGSVSLPNPLPSNDWVNIDFLAQSISISAGQMYSIVVLASNPGTSVSVGVKWDPASYAGGALWWYDGSAWQLNTAFGGGDMQFRTYVETQPIIPAPGALLLGSLGTGLIAGLRRRRIL